MLRRDTDANSILHFSERISLAGARAFFESAELVAIRERAGVHAPDFLCLEEIAAGDLPASVPS